MIGFDGTKAEAAHFATAVRTSDECIKNLTAITNNCSIANLGKELLSVYGYNTSRVICYDFYADGTTICNAATTDTATAQNLYGMVGFSPSIDVQKSFPNYGSYPSVSSGTFMRSFVRSPLPPLNIPSEHIPSFTLSTNPLSQHTLLLNTPSLPTHPPSNIPSSQHTLPLNTPSFSTHPLIHPLISGNISDVTFDHTQSISVSYLLSTAFASTSDPSGRCMYYITSNLEPSTVTQVCW